MALFSPEERQLYGKRLLENKLAKAEAEMNKHQEAFEKSKATVTKLQNEIKKLVSQKH